MAKSQKKSNREVRKPKQTVAKVAPVSPLARTFPNIKSGK
jgi:hypothetical protein